ncbi:MAG: hypothetical protein HKN43_09905 [Rhodothermales bacterium]|nr:hypothetical protein [Rhodothermales bacterium]
MKTGKAILAAVFAFGALVQINDPDPFLWIAIYLIAASTCIFSIYRPAMILPALTIGIIALAWAAWLSPSVIGNTPFTDMFGAWEMKDNSIEKSREMYGLIFITVAMFALAYLGKRESRKT